MSPEARTAARWWADKLRDDFTPDNGDPNAHPMMGVLTSLSREQDRQELTAAKIDLFERVLAERVQAMIDNDVRMGFGVDYHPDPELADSLEVAGISQSVTTLPWKTVMWVRAGHVRVSDGYGAEPRDLELVAS